LKSVWSNTPLVSGVAPIHLWCEQRRIDAILISQGDIDEGADEGIREQVWLQAEVHQTGMLRIVVMGFCFDARIRNVVDLYMQAHLLSN
jgi:hypothetical protein